MRQAFNQQVPFIFVPNQSNQVWQLRFLISTICLIMAVVVSILFHPDKPVIDLTLGPTEDLLMQHQSIKSNSEPFTELEVLELHTQVVEERTHLVRPHLDFPYLKSAHSGEDIRYAREERPHSGEFNFSNILGPNQSDPVWQLRLLAAFSLVYTQQWVFSSSPETFKEVMQHIGVMLITSFGVPIVVAVITLLVSIWLVPDPSGRSDWITGLSVANFSLLGGRLAVYWTLKQGTENKLRAEES